MTDLPQDNPAPTQPPATATNTVWERAVMESVALGYLKEQRRARQWRNALRLAWLVFLVVLSWVVLHRGASSTSTSTAHTAVIEIKGEIDADGLAGSSAVVTSLRSAFEDEGSQAVVLLINSPGGSPVQAGIINDEILRLKKKTQQTRLCGGGRVMCIGGLLHCGGGRSNLCRQGQHRGQHWRADGWLWLHRLDGQAGY